VQIATVTTGAAAQIAENRMPMVNITKSAYIYSYTHNFLKAVKVKSLRVTSTVIWHSCTPALSVKRSPCNAPFDLVNDSFDCHES
jgi:hypothetical protein